MNDLTIAGAPATMSSLEIAELTGKEHRNVMRDIRTMLTELHGEGGVLSFEHTHTNPQNGQSYPIFKLPKRESLILVSGYSVAMRAAIIDRWQELEAEASDPMRLLADPAKLRGMLLSYTEKVVALEQKVEEMTPKAEFHDAVTEAINGQTVQEVAKVLKTGSIRLFQFLRDEGLLMRNNLPYQQHIDAGHFRVVERAYTDKHGEKVTYTRTLVTGKGLALIQRRLHSQAILPPLPSSRSAGRARPSPG